MIRNLTTSGSSSKASTTSKRRGRVEKARRRTAREVEAARKAIEARLGTARPRRGRPPKGAEKYTPVSIRLDPRVLAWAKREAKKRGLGYQTIINQVLLKASA